MTTDRDQDVALRAAWATTASGTPHVDGSGWEALIEGRLDAATRDSLLDHVGSCARCAGVFRAVRAAALEATRAERKAETARAARPALARPWLARPWLAPVAAVLATATAVVVLSRQAMSPSVAPETIATSPVARPSAAPLGDAASLATTPSLAPVFDFPVEKPPVVIAAERLLAQRGRAQDQAWLTSFARALDPYRAGDFEEAARRLAVVAESQPDVAEPALYLGVSLLLGGRASEAIAPLERARGLVGEARRAEVAFYLGCAQARSGDLDAARPTLEGACRAKADHSEKACEALHRLDAVR